MTNLSYADQAFRDSSGTLDETAFAKFIDTNLDVKEAVKINAAVLKKVLGKLKNKGLKDALQDSGY